MLSTCLHFPSSGITNTHHLACVCVQSEFRGSKLGGLCAYTVRNLTAEHGPRHFKVLFLRSLLSDSGPRLVLLPRRQTSMVFVAELGHLIEVNVNFLIMKCSLIQEVCWVFLKECGCLLALPTGRKQSPLYRMSPHFLVFIHFL